jgi:PAS domain S-box-containing protein/putative nucleotidyltransferase with HDIG domain
MADYSGRVPPLRGQAGTKGRQKTKSTAADWPRSARAAAKKPATSGLKASETRYRRLFEAAQDGILILDARTGMIDDVNPFLIKMLGYPRTELVKRKLWEVGAFSDAAASHLAFERLQRRGHIRYDDLPLKAKDGRLLQVEFVSNVYIAGGKKVIQCNIRDITERKRLELVQQEGEQRLRDLLQNSADGITLVDAAGRVLWDSPAAAGMLGYSAQQWIGKDLVQLVHPEDRPAIQRALKALARAPRSRASETFRVRAGNGGWIWLEAIATNKLADPGVKAIVINYRDVTDRKQALEQLAASEAELRTLFSAMTDVVIVYDREGHYVRIAPTGGIALFGDRNDLVGKSVQEVLPTELADSILDKIGQVLDTGQSHQFEYGLTVEGNELWFAAGAAPLSENTVIWVAHEITNRKTSEQALKQQLGHLQSLHAIDQAIAGSTNVNLVLAVILGQVRAELGVDAADVLLYNPHSLFLEYANGAGFRTGALEQTHLPLGQGYAGKAALERKTVHLADLRGQQTDILRSAPFSLEGQFAQEDFVDYHAVPLIAKGKIKGVLEIFNRSPLEDSADWTRFLDIMARQAAIGIDSTELFEDLQRSNFQLGMAYDATIEGWSRALDMRDKETEGHTKRVTETSVALARLMGLPEEELTHLRRGALLHDIGKMGVPDAILLKPGPLTEEEWVLMKQHPGLAHEMLSRIEYLLPALNVPYCHHEKWDGTGYPRGLKGDDIPLAARIFAVVDVYDALTSDRPYRPAWTQAETIEHIRMQSGRQFDPAVVEVFLKDILRADRS